MIGAMARHRVQVLRAGGKTLRRIAAESGIPLRSVKRIVREPAIAEPGDVASALERGVGRPSVVEAYRDRIAAVLARSRWQRSRRRSCGCGEFRSAKSCLEPAQDAASWARVWIVDDNTCEIAHPSAQPSGRPCYFDLGIESRRLEEAEHPIDRHFLQTPRQDPRHRAPRKTGARRQLRVSEAATVDLPDDRSDQLCLQYSLQGPALRDGELLRQMRGRRPLVHDRTSISRFAATSKFLAGVSRVVFLKAWST